jgi:hypothetical protein
MTRREVVAVANGKVYLSDGTVLLECVPSEPGQLPYRELAPIPGTDRATYHANWDRDERKAS